MKNKENIGELLVEITKDKTAEIYSVVCEVLEIDETARICDCRPLNGNADIFGVRLQANENESNGVVVIPVVGTNVVVTFLNKLTGFVSVCSEVDKIMITGTDLKMNFEQITINDGENGGLINVSDLVEKLNTIEDDLNTLKTAVSGWVPVANDGGAGFKTASASWSGQQITPTQTTDIEDDKIKH